MERRKFVIGMGALAAGGAAGLGTGAFSAMTAERDAYIDVVNDADGLVGLKPGWDAGDRVSEEDGELSISFSTDDGDGVNVNSRYQVGNWWGGEDPTSGDYLVGGPGVPNAGMGQAQQNNAFAVVNQDSADHEVTIEYDPDGDVGDSTLYFQLIPNDGSSLGGQAGSMTIDDDSGDSFTATVTSGGYLGVSILVDTRGGSTDDELSGTLTVSAD